MATPRESLQAWERILRQAEQGAKAAAEAMARHAAERAQDMLQRSSHAPGAYYKAPPGAPPAYGSGGLADSMYWTRGAGSSTRASARAGNRARHAKILEYGCEVTPARRKVMHWTDSGGSWYHRRLDVDPHPFFHPAVDEAINDGGLAEAAAEAFREYDP